MNKNKKNIIISVILLLIAVVYTILVKYVDIQAIGPNESLVGFGTVNAFFKELFGVNMTLYKLTNWLGYVAIIMALIYALVGLIQFVKRKNLFKVDKEIFILGIFYVIVIGLYLFFEKFIINYRPVLMDGLLEASYPSSHTVLSLCICGSSLIINNILFKRIKIARIENKVSMVLIFAIVIGRLVSGVHWFTDIVGGVLISIALLKIFQTALQFIKKDN